MFPVGRLDADTEGLLLLTNDGELANRVAHPSTGVEKEYLAEVEVAAGRSVSPAAIRTLREGVELDDGITAPAKVTQPSPGVLRITIHEGRNRQVRRMCEAVGHPVRRLVRVRIGPLTDRRLKPGEWRELSTDEVRRLAVGHGANRAGPPKRPRSVRSRRDERGRTSIGLGLIGGSIALGLRSRGWHVSGDDVSTRAVDDALARGVHRRRRTRPGRRHHVRRRPGAGGPGLRRTGR